MNQIRRAFNSETTVKTWLLVVVIVGFVAAAWPPYYLLLGAAIGFVWGIGKAIYDDHHVPPSKS